MNFLLRLRAWLLAIAMAFPAATAWSEAPRIAVAAEGAHAEAPVSSVAARAPHILIFEAGTMVESDPNPAAANPGSAGPALARWLAEKKVRTLIAGEFGDKLGQAMKERGIDAVRASGPAAKAVKEARP
jgi:predicted Fe-Mo cluster-binding NifX family protein